jgi:hypothetical protein
MKIPTEPISGIPRPQALLDAVEAGGDAGSPQFASVTVKRP